MVLKDVVTRELPRPRSHEEALERLRELIKELAKHYGQYISFDTFREYLTKLCGEWRDGKFLQTRGFTECFNLVYKLLDGKLHEHCVNDCVRGRRFVRGEVRDITDLETRVGTVTYCENVCREGLPEGNVHVHTIGPEIPSSGDVSQALSPQNYGLCSCSVRRGKMRCVCITTQYGDMDLDEAIDKMIKAHIDIDRVLTDVVKRMNFLARREGKVATIEVPDKRYGTKYLIDVVLDDDIIDRFVDEFVEKADKICRYHGICRVFKVEMEV